MSSGPVWFYSWYKEMGTVVIDILIQIVIWLSVLVMQYQIIYRANNADKEFQKRRWINKTNNIQHIQTKKDVVILVYISDQLNLYRHRIEHNNALKNYPQGGLKHLNLQ